MSAEHLTALLLICCDDQGIPEPSVVVYSGRGLQVKWALDKPVPASALPRWATVEAELYRRLAHFGADACALDASRVLRLQGSINSRSGEMVRVTHRARIPTMGATIRSDGVVAVAFEVFADTLLPVNRRDLERARLVREELETSHATDHEADRRRRQAVRDNLVVVQGGSPQSPASACRALVPSSLAWDRLSDLRRLLALRGWQGGVPMGHRDTVLFLASCFLATAKVARCFHQELRALAREFVPTMSDAEVRASVCAVANRTEAAARGDKVMFHDEPVDPRYRFCNSTLIQLLGISGDEQRELATIIDRDEARRRDTARHAQERRAQGCMTRDEYVARGIEMAKRARELREQSLSLSQISKELGISRTSASRYCSKT